MDTSEDFKAVIAKGQAGTPVTTRDIAVAIANDNQSLASYLVWNDLAQLYKLINQSEANMVIGDNAGFIPDADRAAAEMHALIERSDWKDLNYILSNFKINLEAHNWTSHNDLLEELKAIGAIIPEPAPASAEGRYKASYIFKLQFA